MIKIIFYNFELRKRHFNNLKIQRALERSVNRGASTNSSNRPINFDFKEF